MNELGFTPFRRRAIDYLGTREHAGNTLKTYSVLYDGAELDAARFERGWELARKDVPPADPSSGRPGLGFVIFHQGLRGDYVVLCWWDRENELPTKVWPWDGNANIWRRAQTGESFCVWDLEIFWFERQAYVRNVMSAEGASREAYLADVFEPTRLPQVAVEPREGLPNDP